MDRQGDHARRALRRKLCGSAAAALALMRVPAAAQPPRTDRKVRIGRLSEGGPASGAAAEAAFRAALRHHGYDSIVLETRYAKGQLNLLAPLAAELARLNVETIWTNGTEATRAMKDATRTIPIVMVSGDAERAGLVQNLARPEGNLTGLTLIGTDLVAKRIELLKEIAPGTKTAVALFQHLEGRDVPIVRAWLKDSEAAARALGLEFGPFELSSSNPQAWDADFVRLGASGTGTAVSVMESPFFLGHGARLAELMQRHRLPAAYALNGHVDAGGLVSYGMSLRYIFERSAYFVARILDGVRPTDLPVEQPTQYELAINLKTASALGLEVPKAILLRADRVIK
jgi:putative tryptophan/tyrosine transport system substrate-binding protein